MSNVPGRLTDLEFLLEEQSAFRCYLCSDEPNILYRLHLAEWPREGWECVSDMRSMLRRCLVCPRCFRAFEFRDLAATAKIADKVWWLAHPGPFPPMYTREKWLRYVEWMRKRQLTHASRVRASDVIVLKPRSKTKRTKATAGSRGR